LGYFLKSSSLGGTKGAKKEKAIILAGESGSGKTAFLYYLAKNEVVQTVSSIELTDAKIKLDKSSTNSKETRILDIPGHVNFRSYVYQELENAKSVIFMIDASKRENVYDSASFLYELFIQKKFTSMKTPMLIVSNKRDLEKSIDKKELKEELIKEIERLKLSKRSHTNLNLNDDYIVEDKERFRFENVKGGKVAFANNSIVNDDDGVKDREIFEEFLRN